MPVSKGAPADVKRTRRRFANEVTHATWVSESTATREGARAFREGLEELGTTFVKLGQLLSSRPDLLPDVYIEELEHLVDDPDCSLSTANPRPGSREPVEPPIL